MTVDLPDEEAAALTRYLRQKLDDERFPLAPRLNPLKAVLAKVDPPAPRPEPLPPLKPGKGPTVGRGERGRWNDAGPSQGF
jgi:hypothetical protein